MQKLITPEELVALIRRERRGQEKTLRELGEIFGVSHQTISQAEDPNRGGVKIDQLRMRILSYLLGREVTGPVFVIGEELED